MSKKYIHYCWFGGKPLPKLAKKCIKSWKKYLPDYLDFADKAISQSISRTKILGLEVETITGKAKRPQK